MPDFLRLNSAVGYGALAEAMARWQAAQVSALIALTPLFTLLFSDFYQWPGPMFRQTVKPDWLCGFVVVARDVFRHRSSSWGTSA